MQYAYWLYQSQRTLDDQDDSFDTEELLSSDAIDPWEEGFMNGSDAAS